ncbi:hypothetical protein PMAL9190_00654 [Photobacterium malacitanum]|uniref:Uncharacterized protein n=1 Tax=Photobacterium malacitanum TaxID=2204294 RepID=A0A1Y6M811_9GAMM|nr:hypothetical protein [Photobacterium malacitanum]SMY32685.1 hypothetical protein PMAL9190_00654 [Photobacterium malacitanum]
MHKLTEDKVMGAAINIIGLSIIIGKYILMLILAITTVFGGMFTPELIPTTINGFNE